VARAHPVVERPTTLPGAAQLRGRGWIPSAATWERLGRLRGLNGVTLHLDTDLSTFQPEDVPDATG
jgi:hypothetical protein